MFREETPMRGCRERPTACGSVTASRALRGLQESYAERNGAANPPQSERNVMNSDFSVQKRFRSVPTAMCFLSQYF